MTLCTRKCFVPLIDFSIIQSCFHGQRYKKNAKRVKFVSDFLCFRQKSHNFVMSILQKNKHHDNNK